MKIVLETYSTTIELTTAQHEMHRGLAHGMWLDDAMHTSVWKVTLL